MRPVLLQVLQTLILGLAEVERYFTQQGQQIKLPEGLKDRKNMCTLGLGTKTKSKV